MSHDKKKKKKDYDKVKKQKGYQAKKKAHANTEIRREKNSLTLERWWHSCDQ